MSPRSRLFEIDLRSMAAFRIVLGALLLVDLAIRATAFHAHYTEVGVFPLELVKREFEGTWRWSLHWLDPSAGYQLALFVVAAAAAGCLALGILPRLAAAACWVLWTSLQTRSPLLLNGGDDLLRMLLFWSMFLPLGSLWSVGGKRNRRGSGSVRSLASAGILLQVVWMYWVAGYWKHLGGWSEGNELHRIMHFDSYARPLAGILRDRPEWTSVAGRAVVWIELLVPWMLLVPVRRWTFRVALLGLLAGLHLGIELTLTVGLYSYVCWAALLLFLPSGFWDAIGRMIPARWRIADVRAAIDSSPAPPRRLAWALSCLLAFPVAHAAWWNLSAVGVLDAATAPAALRRGGELLGLHQNWRLFDRAPTRDGWHIAIAWLEDGRGVDLLRGGVPLDERSFAKPESVSGRFPDHRWRKLYRQLVDDRHAEYRETLCRYLGRSWNGSQPDLPPAVRVELQYMEEMDDAEEDASGESTEPMRMQRLLSAVEFSAPQPTSPTTPE